MPLRVDDSLHFMPGCKRTSGWHIGSMCENEISSNNDQTLEKDKRTLALICSTAQIGSTLHN